MKFTTGLLLILLIVGLMTLSRRRKAGSENKLSGPYAGPSAAEQEPTATGRYRVKQMLEKTKGHYPSPLEILDVMTANHAAYGDKLRGDVRERAMVREAQGFGRLAATEISKNLIRIFGSPLLI